MWERLILWIRGICFYQQMLNLVIDWLRSGFTSHSTQNRSFWRRFPKPISRLGMKKLNLTQQKHTFTNQKKCTTQNKHKRTKARCSCLLQNPAWTDSAYSGFGRQCLWCCPHDHGHCESSPGSFDECRLSAGWPPTLRPSQPTCAPIWLLPSTSTITICYYYSAGKLILIFLQLIRLLLVLLLFYNSGVILFERAIWFVGTGWPTD